MPHSKYFSDNIKPELKGRMVLVIYTDSSGLHFSRFPSEEPDKAVMLYHPLNENLYRVYGGLSLSILNTLEDEGYYDEFAKGRLELGDFDRMLVRPSFLEWVSQQEEEEGR